MAERDSAEEIVDFYVQRLQEVCEAMGDKDLIALTPERDILLRKILLKAVKEGALTRAKDA